MLGHCRGWAAQWRLWLPVCGGGGRRTFDWALISGCDQSWRPMGGQARPGPAPAVWYRLIPAVAVQLWRGPAGAGAGAGPALCRSGSRCCLLLAAWAQSCGPQLEHSRHHHHHQQQLWSGWYQTRGRGHHITATPPPADTVQSIVPATCRGCQHTRTLSSSGGCCCSTSHRARPQWGCSTGHRQPSTTVRPGSFSSDRQRTVDSLDVVPGEKHGQYDGVKPRWVHGK